MQVLADGRVLLGGTARNLGVIGMTSVIAPLLSASLAIPAGLLAVFGSIAVHYFVSIILLEGVSQAL